MPKNKTTSEQTIRVAAVIVPFFRRDGDLHLVLVLRGERGIHGGHLAFPGGKPHPDDTSLLDTALREMEEETGVSRSAVEVIEALPVLETRTTNYRIYPYLARIREQQDWQPRAGEIAEVIEVKVADLLDPAMHGEMLMAFETWSIPQRRPFIRIGPYRLWGATYRILMPLLDRIAGGAWSGGP